MAWLGTWEKRRKVVVSNTNIGSNLTHFPLLLTLGTSVGTGNTDVSSIFDELTSDANRTKIAFTKTDGTTQLYAEIEKWDDTNETAVIWISKSDLVLASGVTTDVYMYYDATQDANTTYIGDTNSEVAENVWDSNYKVVQHLSDGANTSGTYDSTSNDNDGTKTGAAEPAVTTSGKIGNAQDFDGVDDIITLANAPLSGAGNEMTFGSFVKYDAIESNDFIVLMSGGYRGFSITIDATNANNLNFYIGDGSVYHNDYKEAHGMSVDNWYYVVCRYDYVNFEAFINGVSIGTYGDVFTPNWESATSRISHSADNGTNGIMDEVRISNIARSDDWIKANYYTQTDALVAWNTEEEYVVDMGNFFQLF